MDSTGQKPTTRSTRKRGKRNPVGVLATEAAEAMLDKKALDVTVMDMRAVSGVADVFVIATGESELQIKAIADAVTERIRERLQERPWHVEGYEGRQWVLLDYVDLVVHIFSTDKRQFYDLERLWGDAPRELIDGEADVAEAKLLQKLRANGATSS